MTQQVEPIVKYCGIHGEELKLCRACIISVGAAGSVITGDVHAGDEYRGIEKELKATKEERDRRHTVDEIKAYVKRVTSIPVTMAFVALALFGFMSLVGKH